MQDKYNKFFSDNNNKSVEKEDSSALDQCMDLAFAWCDSLGIDRAAIRHGYAYQIWAQLNDTTRKYFDVFKNDPNFVPQVGDIAVFGIASGVPVGHVSIVAPGSTVMNLVTFDQNWDTLHYNKGTDPNTGLLIPYSRIVVHYNYYACVGFLRAKNQAPQPTGDDVLLNKIKTIVDGSGDPRSKISSIRAIL